MQVTWLAWILTILPYIYSNSCSSTCETCSGTAPNQCSSCDTTYMEAVGTHCVGKTSSYYSILQSIDGTSTSSGLLTQLVVKDTVYTSSNFTDAFEDHSGVNVLKVENGDNSTMVFQFAALGFDHWKLLVKFTMQTNQSSSDVALVMGSLSQTLSPNAADVFTSSELSHESASVQVQLTLPTINSPNYAFIQSITLLAKKCQPQCSLCPAGANIRLYGSTTCGQSCQMGTYQSGNICEQCDTGCGACTGSGSCTGCTDNTYLHNGACVDACPSGFIESLTTMECVSCDAGCAECEGTTSNCTSCKEDTSHYFKQPNENSCKTTCPQYYFKQSDHTCVLCTDGTYGDADMSSVDACQSTCFDGCSKCFGAGNDSCLACTTGSSDTYYLLKGSTICDPTCSVGTYGDNHVCLDCDENCEECSGTSTTCTKCGISGGKQLYLAADNVCYESCSDGFYPDTSNNECGECTEGCTLCYGTGLDKCTECGAHTNTSEYFKVVGEDQCTLNCPVGYYEESFDGYNCVLCHEACASCDTSATDCQSCKNVTGNVFYNLNDLCYQTCPDGYYGVDSTNLCSACHASCSQCFEAANDTCTACAENKFLQYGTTTCVDSCPDGQYENSTARKCLPCDSNCKTCDTEAENCTSCFLVNGFYVYLDQNLCVQECPEGQYEDSGSKTCQPCAQGCATCDGPSVNHCQTCSNSSDNSKMFYKIIGYTTCSETCPTGQFIDSAIDFECQACSSSCVDCVGLATNCTAADKCSEGLFFRNDTNNCVSSCPDGLYGDVITGICENCEEGCTLCYGSGLSQCTECGAHSNTSEYFKVVGEDQCTLQCGAGLYEESNGYSCVACHEACETCDTSATNCQSCKNVTGNVYYNLDNICYETCPDEYYGVASTNLCQACHASCFQCFEGANDTCTACIAGKFLQYGTTTCADSCPDGQYENSTAKKCLPCDSNCKTCDTEAENCTSCYMSSGAYVFLSGNICVQNCPDGEYERDSDYTCASCASGCLTCYGPDLTDCFSCQDPGTPHYKVVGEDTCATGCPAGQFISQTLSSACELCSPECVECQTNADNCLSSAGCAADHYFYNLTNSCMTECPDGYYEDGNGFCELCTEGCTLCYGTGLDKCTECGAHTNTSEYFKVVGEDQCTLNCPVGYYEESFDGYNCVLCHEACASCDTSATDCQSCKNVTGNVFYNLNDLCYQTCPDGYYGVDSTNLCSACHASCSQCFEAANDTCTACAENKFLQYGTTTCADSCPDGQYENSTARKCLPCDSNCKTCDTEAENCTSCFLVNGFYVYLDQNLCVQECPEGQYEDSGSKTCQPCAQGCATCDGPSVNHCQTCSNSSDNSKMFYKIIGYTTCSETCPTGQFIDSAIDFECQACSSSCVDCVGLATNCTAADKCSEGLFFRNDTNNCVSSCPDGLYGDVITGICENCEEGCTLCYGSGLSQCTECGAHSNTSEYFKVVGEDQCTLQCGAGLYEESNGYSCVACHEACETCDTSATNCQSCKNVTGNVYYNLDNICYETCPDEYYGVASTNLCQACHASCFQCFEGANDTCTACIAGKFLQYGTTTCADSCPDGQYENSTAKKCLPCDSNCKTCDTEAENCTSCYMSSGAYVFLSGNICVQNCPDGEYERDSDYTCASCASGCLTCYGPDLTDCFSCQDPGTPHYKVVGEDTCATGCPAGQFISQTLSSACELCSPECVECQTNADNCLSSAGCAADHYFYNLTNSCMTECPDGYYEDGNGFCELCTEGCTLCYGTGLDKCTECGAHTNTSEYFKVVGEDQCTLNCPVGYYEESFDGYNCVLCHEACASCDTSATDCQSCKNVTGNVFYNLNDLCYQTCPDGYYGVDSTNLCSACHASCSQCFEAANDTCTACAENKFLQYGTTTCADSCPDGQYENSTARKCLPCDSNCKTCDTEAENCTSCFLVNGFYVYLDQNLCVQECPEGQYEDSGSKTCQPCAQGCATCDGPSVNHCQTCSNSSDNSKMFYKIIGYTTCSETCPTGQFIDSAIDFECQACSSSCVDCVGLATNCTAADKCSEGLFFRNDTNNCVSSCPDGLYGDVITGICENCEEGCTLCYGSGLSQCTECGAHSNTSEYFKVVGEDQCTLQCGAGLYEESNGYSCVACHEACETCDTSATNCQSCKNVTGNVYYNLDNICYETCPDEYYGVASTNLCQACHASCFQCFEGANDTCTACIAGKFLQYGTTTCADSCPDGQYENSTAKKCLPCDSNCKTCDTEAENCTSCYMSSGAYVFLSGNICVQNCPDGEYERDSDYTCASCASGCLTCYGPDLTDCFSCQDPGTPHYKVVGEDTCATGCPAGQFISQTLSSACELCSPECVECQTNADNCLSSAGCAADHYFYNLTNSCMTECPDGYYEDGNGFCELCTEGCTLCYGTGLDKCTECGAHTNTSEYFKVVGEDQCTLNCPVGYYEESFDGYNCVLCHEACASCDTSATDCQSCKNVTGNVFYNLNDLCYQTCPDGYYGVDSTNLCSACHASCSQCFEAANDTCTACAENKFLQYGTTTCADSCPDGQYENSTARKCLPCDSNCKTCDTEAENCTSCFLVNGFYVYLDQNLCVQECPEGQYEDSGSKTCQPCAQGCATCDGPSVNHCQTCSNSSDNSKMFYKIIGYTTCSETCPTGQFIDSAIDFECQACSSSCVDCVGLATNCTAADKCSEGLFFRNDTNNCVSSCPDGLYGDVITGICENCEEGCTLCYGSGLSQCTECGAHSNTSEYFKVVGEDQCTLQCGAGLYEESNGYSCVACHEACETCDTSATNCQSCKNVTGNVYYNLDNICYETCPDEYYGVASTNLCQACHASCFQCFEGANDTCTACIAGKFLQYGTTTCADSCPDGQYENSTAKKCLPCDSNCKTCDTEAENCTSCYMSSGAYVFLSGNICVQNCPDGEYERDSDYTCASCASGCLTCYGPDLTDCFSCQDPGTPHYKVVGEDTCATGCPAGQFISQTLSSACELCSPECVECQTNADNCLSSAGCAADHYFYNLTNSCMTECPDGYYEDGNGFCELCTEGCTLCYGTGLDKCTECGAHTNTSEYFKVVGEDQCTLNCPVGYYEESFDGYNCVLCHEACASCDTSATDCQSCKNVTGNVFYNLNDLCYQTCPDGYYGVDSTNLCSACHASCSQCFEAANDTCTACAENKFLQYGTTTCVDSCPDGQYENSTARKCLPCDSNCKTCDTEAENCTSCFLVNGFYVYLDQNLCVQECPEGQYEDSGSKTCQPCAQGCATCDGPSVNHCQTCSNSSDNSKMFYKIIGYTTCSETCPTGQFIDSAIDFECQACSSSCVDCVGLATNCTAADKCSEGLFFRNDTNNCVSSCPDGLYGDVITGICENCEEGCTLCYGSGLSQCTECGAHSNTSEYFKVVGEDQCTLQCGAGLYEESNGYSCVACHEACETCDTSATNCQSCKNVTGNVYYNLDNICYETCPDEYYGVASTNLCQACHASCFQCFEGANDTCTACIAGKFLQYGTTTCADSCPDGQYENSTAKKCLPCDSNCKTCDTEAENCTSCYMSSGAYVFLSGNICVQNCPDGEYERDSDYTCASCASGCLTCYGPDLTDCFSCQDPGTPHYKVVGEDTCATGCPAGQFISQTLSSACELCSPECVECQTNADNCLSSAGCAADHYFYNLTNSCMTECPDGYYEDGNGFCELCTEGCTLCYGTGLDKCTECGAHTNTSEYFKVVGEDQCTLNCPVGYYEESFDGYNCVLCHEACASCDTSATDCQSCKNVTGNVFYNLNDLCYQTCPDGYYGVDSTNLCSACHASCSQCFEAANDTCTACAENKFLQYGTTTCVDSCPDGQYENSTARKCLPCDSNCKTCDTEAENCTSCFLVNGFYVYLDQNLCVQECPEGQYEESDTSTCQECIEGCQTCFGSTLYDCITCQNSTDNTKTFYKVIGQTICSETCPKGQFIDSSIPFFCQQCAPQCDACQTRADNCIVAEGCAAGFYFYNSTNSCLDSCPVGYYEDLITGFCQACLDGCVSCEGGSYQECTECGVSSTNASKFYWKRIGLDECVEDCPAGEYQLLLGTYQCVKCHQSCATCQSSDIDCPTCKNVTGNVYYHYQSTCVQTCPDGYYGQPSSNQCVACHDACATCFGAGTTSCRSCKTNDSTPYYLSFGTTECVTECLPGEYENITSHLCMVCDSNCDTCDQLSTTCTSCYLNNGVYVFLEGTICVQDCEVGYYQYYDDYTCQPCVGGCAACDGPTLTDCDACTQYDGDTYYKDRNSRTCALTCPVGQYINSNIPYICQFCEEQCIHCISEPDNCKASYGCAEDYFYYQPDSSCIMNCPVGYYGDAVNTFDCLECADGCQACYGPGHDACTKCQIDSQGTGYYKRIFVDECVDDCPAGQYEVLISQQCAKCHDSCVLCNTSATDCQQCRNFSGIEYFLYDNQCLVECPDGYWGDISTNQCEACKPQCPTCFGNTTQQCYSCTNSGGVDYYLQLGTTYCVDECPYGEYEVVENHTCQLCNINCATCDGNSTFCLSCTYVNTINIVYLYDDQCVTFCPVGYWANSTVDGDHQCSKCHEYCVACSGPTNVQCSICGNITDTIYYKDLQSDTCNPDCPDGQFISQLIPNSCVPCNSSCVLCAVTANNCSKCTYDFFFYEDASLCTQSCPLGYFNDPTLTDNNYYCTLCQDGCESCTGPSLSDCQSCETVTINNQQQVYYKHQSQTLCTLECDIEYYGNDGNNMCEPCQQGCAECDINSTYCSKCKSQNGNDYYKVMDSNECTQTCPDGTYGDPSTYSCIDCPYFSYEGECLLECPNQTNVEQTTGKVICQNCSDADRTCDERYEFTMNCEVSEDGKSLKHSIALPEGLHESIGEKNLTGTVVYLVLDTSRRLLQTKTPLDISEIRISSDRSTIFIQTENVGDIDFSKAEFQVNFPGGTMIAEDGTPYSSTSVVFELDDPQFEGSYYRAFQENTLEKVLGLVFLCLCFVLFFIVLCIQHRQTHHQIMGFIMFLQCIGLLRMRTDPIDGQVFNSLLGFSQYQILFIPNVFFNMFPEGYTEAGYPAVQFAWGDHNFIRHMGSCFLVYVPLQVILWIYIAADHQNQQRVHRYKYLQEAIIQFFMVLVIFNFVSSILALTLNSFTANIQFMISELLAFILFFAYCVYFIGFIRKHLDYELYKLINIIRAVSIGIMCLNLYAGIIIIVIFQSVFMVVDCKLYMMFKLNSKLYVVDRVLMLTVLICASLLEEYIAINVCLGLVVGVIFCFKLYYVVVMIIIWKEERKKKQLSDIPISDHVHMSHKHKSEQSEKNSSADDPINEKIVHQSTIIFNQNISRIQHPSKQQILEDSVDGEEERKDYSSQSNGELIVYLDPEVYQKQEKEKIQMEKESPDRLAMRTTANFFRRRRNIPYNDQEVEIIKVEPNESELDHRDEIYSEDSSYNKFAWKIEDVDNVSSEEKKERKKRRKPQFDEEEEF